MCLAFVSALLGLIGSLLLGIPALVGLGDRRAFDQAKELYEQERNQAQALANPATRQAALDDAYKAYRLSCDTYLSDSLGKYNSHRWLNLLGFASLFLSFLLILIDRWNL